LDVQRAAQKSTSAVFPSFIPVMVLAALLSVQSSTPDDNNASSKEFSVLVDA